MISQSHTSITETRWVILNSTHFGQRWLAIQPQQFLALNGGVDNAIHGNKQFLCTAI